MNHKRKRPKHQRAGCLLCKSHKDERVKGARESKTPQEQRADITEAETRKPEGTE